MTKPKILLLGEIEQYVYLRKYHPFSKRHTTIHTKN